ncbi:Pank1 [Symbiodinium natans]|uniref:Pank1 protein n=1 Tax=Symbiodinium natans TaxID=878477 RepID=A0A812RT88_9DINO|nr:Pank1 [Symbiodinium natans]
MAKRVHVLRFVVRFVSGATSQMEQAVQHFGLRRNRSWAFSRQDSVEKLERIARSPKSPFCSASGHWKASSDPCASSCSSRWDGTDTPEAPLEVPITESRLPRVRRVAAAGGGACKFAPLFRNSLHVEIEPVKELSAVVDGLLVLADIGDTARLDTEEESCRTDLFTIDECGRLLPLPWPKQLFPLILVNMGSGVSILKVDSARSNDYTRVGGTACGGATFLGLARALTSARTFEEALLLAEHGDASKADKLVRDIYGDDGSASLGLAGGLTASNFGKLSESSGLCECSEYDLARSLLQMVTQQSVLLATAYAKHADCLDRVFFVGGFIDEPNRLARAAIAQNFRSLGGCAYFLRHSDFLGALGSLHHAFQDLEEHVEGQ